MRHVSGVSIAAGLLTIAVIFGGGGTVSPMSELIVQLAALLALAAYPFRTDDCMSKPVDDPPMVVAVAAFAALPLLHLVPLPPAVWQALPGRQLTVDALSLVGAQTAWRPVSLAPFATIASLLSLIPPLVMLFLVSRLGMTQRSTLLLCLAILAVLAATVGVVQLAGDRAAWLRFYPGQPTNFSTGFQGNRNASADILLIGLLALAAYIAARPGVLATTTNRAVAVSIGAFLLLSVVLTGSRAGMALIAVCALFVLLLLRPRLALSRNMVVGGCALLLVAGAGVFAIRDNPAVDRAISRFEGSPDQRNDLWQDTQTAIRRYWPIGSGIGTFAAVFSIDERLDVVDDSRPVRAHQDFLEFALEAGIAGLVLLAALGIAILVRAHAIYRAGSSPAWWRQTLYALGVLVILAFHSLVDYPLRSMSLATIVAMAIGMLARPAVEATRPRRRTRSSRHRIGGRSAS